MCLEERMPSHLSLLETSSNVGENNQHLINCMPGSYSLNLIYFLEAPFIKQIILKVNHGLIVKLFIQDQDHPP